jgi:hypothetical protein
VISAGRSCLRAEVLFPRRLEKGPRKGGLVRAKLVRSRTLQALHNPRYAGAFVFGRTPVRKHPDGRSVYERPPAGRWPVLIRDVHEGYVSRGEYEENQRRLNLDRGPRGVGIHRCGGRHGGDVLRTPASDPRTGAPRHGLEGNPEAPQRPPTADSK